MAKLFYTIFDRDFHSNIVQLHIMPVNTAFCSASEPGVILNNYTIHVNIVSKTLI